MPATTRATPRASRRAARAARDRTARGADAPPRVPGTLDAVQVDLASLRGDLGRGAGDLRRHLARLLRDARRDVAKTSTLVVRDLGRLQRDLVLAAGVRAGGAAVRRTAARATARRPV
ncbi:MAG: hypothetical protein JSS99_11025 [Actinobacteria bacterium]|nr:hypothetical protein [Actinomycetota bacterium]